MSSDYRPHGQRLLAKLGLFFVDDFIDAELCRSVFAAVQAADGAPAEVFARPGREIAPAMRNATERMPQPGATALDAAIAAVRPALEGHFKLPLGAFEPVSYVTYAPGQYYRPHVDRGPADRADEARERAVSIVLFLNDAFDGGDLVFYNLLEDPRSTGAGFPLRPKTGLLAAFPSHVLHEVTPVTRGVRGVAVTWFHRGVSTIVGASGSIR